MKRMLLFAAVSLVAGCCDPPLVATVDVPTLPQQASNWCWAASGQMTMRFLGHDVAQCTEANDEFGQTNCCKDNSDDSPGKCNSRNGGWPDYPKYNFTVSQTPDQTSTSALTWAQVQGQIYCARKPFAFSWHWNGGGGHMMVAKGYLVVGGVQYVDINDPEPYTNLSTLTGGTEKILTYADYVSGSGYTHWRDYYNITYAGGP